MHQLNVFQNREHNKFSFILNTENCFLLQPFRKANAMVSGYSALLFVEECESENMYKHKRIYDLFWSTNGKLGFIGGR